MSTHPDLGPLPEPRYLLALDGDGYNPERILTESGWSDDQMRDFGQRCYMLGVAVGIEQCADKVRAEADRRTGAARAALLNMADVLRRALPSALTKEGG